MSDFSHHNSNVNMNDEKFVDNFLKISNISHDVIDVEFQFCESDIAFAISKMKKLFVFKKLSHFEKEFVFIFKKYCKEKTDSTFSIVLNSK